jgi:hypothetical protein
VLDGYVLELVAGVFEFVGVGVQSEAGLRLISFSLGLVI